ncbi:MAG: tyrosine-type recombinase/integrase [Steroidobacteraceae bacterium]
MLTDIQVRSAKAADRPRKLFDARGLYLQVTPNGGRYWRFDYAFNGKRKTLALGVYPDVPLVRARARHQEARDQLAQGQDPAADRRERLVRFEQAARAWYDHWRVSRNERHAVYVIRRLEADVFPLIGARPLPGLTASSFREVVQRIERRGAVDIAKRVLQTCSQVMRYAVAHDLIQHNPVAEIKPSDVLKPHKRRNYPRVGVSEMPALLRAIDTYVGSEHTKLALKLMSLTFVRTSELIGARWAEFDLVAKKWSIPPDRMKMKTAHVVPLSRQSLEILDRLKAISFGRELVFPGDINSEKPMSNNTILFALYRLGYRGRMSGHGFRGVASTILHEAGWPHEHIELQLAHQERNAVSAAYNHAIYLESRSKLMQAWADYLDKARNE